MNVSDLFRTILERLQSSAHVGNVYGEPIEAQGKTIIPVAGVGYAFGAGGGSHQEHDDSHQEQRDEAADQQGASAGAGGGGGIGAGPVGVLEVTDDQTRFIPFHNKRKLLAALLVGLLIGWWLGRRR